MKIIALILMFFALPSFLMAGDPAYHAAQVALAGSIAADWGSGILASRNGATEANPTLGQNHGVQAAIMTGVSLPVFLLARKAHKQGSKKVFIVLLGVTALHGYAAAHNFRIK